MSNETILDGALMGAESNYPNDLSSHELKMLDQEQHANSCSLAESWQSQIRSLATIFIACSKSQVNQACN